MNIFGDGQIGRQIDGCIRVGKIYGIEKLKSWKEQWKENTYIGLWRQILDVYVCITYNRETNLITYYGLQ